MSDIAIYQSHSGTVEVRLEKDSVWLRQEQLAELFGRDRTVISRHIRNVLAEARAALAKLKASLIAKGQATVLFAQERGNGLPALLGNLDQTAVGEDVHPTVEAKAAHLLYFVIKNHPFADGNKRSGAYLFVDFLHRNGRLLDGRSQPVINDVGLAALALLVAESPAKNKDTMIRLMMNMLARPITGAGA